MIWNGSFSFSFLRIYDKIIGSEKRKGAEVFYEIYL